MGLKGEFSWIESIRQGGRKAISFTLTNTDMFGKEDFDAVIFDDAGRIEPQKHYALSLHARKAFKFDYDTIGWNWCQGDTFAIVNPKSGKIKDKWVLRLSEYAPGECPSCHGSHKCHSCGGTGQVPDGSGLRFSTITCPQCHGTGECQMCYVPKRILNTQPYMGINRTNDRYAFGDDPKRRQLYILQNRVTELQGRLADARMQANIMQIRGTSTSSYSVYCSQLSLISRYETEIQALQDKIKDLI